MHSGHLAYFQAARELGDKLVVGLNSDEWLARKKGKPFMPMSERFILTSGLSAVDEVIMFDDADGSSCDAIVRTRLKYPDAEIVFANGGDRTQENIPEMRLTDPQVSFAFGVGGTDKKNSSSWILEDWKKPKTDRNWGYYRVLHEVSNHVKLKELTVDPHSCLSMQRHEKRAEIWFVAEGAATVYTLEPGSNDRVIMCTPGKHQRLIIERDEWHQLCNETDQPLKLIEIQFGSSCIEDDIERQ